MVIFGGSRNGVPLNDVWELSLENFTWSLVEATGDAPSPRESTSAIYDEARDRMIIFGGAREIEGGLLSFDEVWVLQFGTTNTWQRLDVSGAGPGLRNQHTAFYVAAQDWMVVTGGFEYGAGRNDVWALTLGANPEWIQVYPNNEGPGAPHTLWNGGGFDPIHNQLVCFGTCCPFTSSIWGFSLDDQTWQDLTPKSAGPSARGGVTQIWDPVLNRLVIFGGTDGYDNYFNESWALKLGDPNSRGRTVLSPVEDGIPQSPVSLEVFPNPVRAQARIVYALPSSQRVNLSVYDLQGRRVATLRNGVEEPGAHEAAWGASAMKGKPSGIYFVRLLTQGDVQTKRFLVVQ
jgi:Secretion system C-terminal sorting domain/Galactose oxidase, central domain